MFKNVAQNKDRDRICQTNTATRYASKKNDTLCHTRQSHIGVKQETDSYTIWCQIVTRHTKQDLQGMVSNKYSDAIWCQTTMYSHTRIRRQKKKYINKIKKATKASLEVKPFSLLSNFYHTWFISWQKVLGDNDFLDIFPLLPKLSDWLFSLPSLYVLVC